MHPHPNRQASLQVVLAAMLLALTGGSAAAQGTAGPSISDSKVGYIDSAIPGDQLRFRYDSAYNNRRQNRAEFFYPAPVPLGPGLPLAEPSVDYQDLMAYAEKTLGERFSIFAELPYRFLNPEVNANANGVADMNAGFKYAFLQNDGWTATFQFRTYAPIGDAGRGLGTRHVSLEPALLIYKPLSDRLSLEGEFRDWIPVGGTDFAGNVIRYGVGMYYEALSTDSFRLGPVAEFVGWTALGGKQTIVPQAGPYAIQDAAGDTIVNAKIGMRLGIGNQADIYAGYGRPITGERWYENVVRVEFRLRF